MFSNRKLKVDYMTYKQLETWFPILLKREFGFDYKISCRPDYRTSKIGMTIEETEMTEESFTALVDYFGRTSFTNADDLIGSIIALSQKQYTKRYENEYSLLSIDREGFYIIRKRLHRIKEKTSSEIF